MPKGCSRDRIHCPGNGCHLLGVHQSIWLLQENYCEYFTVTTWPQLKSILCSCRSQYSAGYNLIQTRFPITNRFQWRYIMDISNSGNMSLVLKYKQAYCTLSSFLVSFNICIYTYCCRWSNDPPIVVLNVLTSVYKLQYYLYKYEFKALSKWC